MRLKLLLNDEDEKNEVKVERTKCEKNRSNELKNEMRNGWKIKLYKSGALKT